MRSRDKIKLSSKQDKTEKQRVQPPCYAFRAVGEPAHNKSKHHFAHQPFQHQFELSPLNYFVNKKMSEKIGTIYFQLDYYPSSQFAGLHLALKSGLYAAKGIDVIFLSPTAAGGEEPDLVVQRQRELDMESGCSYSNFPAGIFQSTPKVSVGSAEQSVILAGIARNVQVKAFATIFQESPLSLASLPGLVWRTY